MHKSFQKVNILGVDVDDVNLDDAVAKILEFATDKSGKHIVVTINTEFIMLARKKPDFMQILKHADLAVADGAWVVLAKLFSGGQVHDRVTGVDLVESICKEAAKKAIRVGFLGGFSSVANMVGKRQKIRHPSLKIAISEPGDPAIGYDLRLRNRLFKIGRVDILFVAYGMGQQEFWIERNKNSLPVGVFIGVGGAFDYLSGTKRRAPIWLQAAGFEWLWRLILEPYRIWRMRVLPIFLILFVKSWLSGKFAFLVNR